MKKTGESRKAAARCISTILANVAAIGIGFVIYDGRIWCLFLAIVAAWTAAKIAWRAEEYDD